jgi:general L-amino acid transport system permease protein
MTSSMTTTSTSTMTASALPAATGKTFAPIAAREAPVKTEGLLAWVRINLFSDIGTSLMTLIVGGALLYVVPQLLSWAIFRASWAPNFEACRVPGVGACWGVVTEKYRIILFGRYPFEEQWRPLVATGLLLGRGH